VTWFCLYSRVTKPYPRHGRFYKVYKGMRVRIYRVVQNMAFQVTWVERLFSQEYNRLIDHWWRHKIVPLWFWSKVCFRPKQGSSKLWPWPWHEPLVMSKPFKLSHWTKPFSLNAKNFIVRIFEYLVRLQERLSTLHITE